MLVDRNEKSSLVYCLLRECGERSVLQSALHFEVSIKATAYISC